MNKDNKKALYAGSFNPFHNGHYQILLKALNLFDEVYLLVAQNPNKPKNDIIENINLIKEKTKGLKNLYVLEPYENILTAKVAQKLKITYLIRSARNNLDFQYELELASLNKGFNPTLETIIIIPDEEYVKYSSSQLQKIKEQNV
ncbi:pantetheine-phosphate adenylyltransferase [Mycoplasmopsis bovirhinis]|uniref:pantetheine-phosphate adenylyltransferase n=1 Tax=Mycoplasmopsis bovirhinis TaxID=29553 RepID=UPI000C058424|nr:pantetheine-phosphate adenylyltransferase [Mycoplasmopsis bovirhinis]ATO31075.1 pantetheine-phosphate adenylyltransferase [Mycoplasmopsis bovirhinis]